VGNWSVPGPQEIGVKDLQDMAAGTGSKRGRNQGKKKGIPIPNGEREGEIT